MSQDSDLERLELMHDFRPNFMNKHLSDSVAKKLIAIRWIEPSRIVFKLDESVMKQIDVGVEPDPDWDQRIQVFDETMKHTSISLHFREMVPWVETPLFEHYRQRLSEGETVRGQSTFGDLVRLYETRMERLYRELASGGISKTRIYRSKLQESPWVALDRNRRYLFGSQGNHRLSIAKVLGLESFPVWIVGSYRRPRERINQGT